MTAGLAEVGSTILRRLEAAGTDSPPHRFTVSSMEAGDKIEVGSSVSGVSLFVLERSSDGRLSLDSAVSERLNSTEDELRATEPDPLWESASSICSHMEDDHSNTFGLFLNLIGRSDLSQCDEIRMPWVEAGGFYLSTEAEHHFIPFPQRCEDANSVRATLIKMLRGARAAHSTD